MAICTLQPVSHARPVRSMLCCAGAMNWLSHPIIPLHLHSSTCNSFAPFSTHRIAILQWMTGWMDAAGWLCESGKGTQHRTLEVHCAFFVIYKLEHLQSAVHFFLPFRQLENLQVLQLAFSTWLTACRKKFLNLIVGRWANRVACIGVFRIWRLHTTAI